MCRAHGTICSRSCSAAGRRTTRRVACRISIGLRRCSAISPNYALGESLAAQLFTKATAEDKTILPALATGDFKPYFGWVKPRIHEQASLKSFDEIVVGATGQKLSGAALKAHLKKRYLEEPLA